MSAAAVIVRAKPADIAAKIPVPPKNVDENRVWREWMADRGGNDAAWAEAFRLRAFGNAPESVEFWFDGFAWTLDTLEHTNFGNAADFDPNIPFILFPRQAEEAKYSDLALQTKTSYLLEKSRGVGASWYEIGVITRRWQFDTNANFLVGSEKEEKVDGKGMDPLLPKAAYLLDRMPGFMNPAGFACEKPHRIFKSITNPVTECVIKGEARNDNFGRGGRFRRGLLDEHAFMERAESIQAGVANACKSFTSISTPNGRGTYQAQLRFGGKIPVRRLHWTDNPMLARGLYTCSVGCQLHPQGGQPHSPHYDQMAALLNMDVMEVAKEMDIDYGKSGGAAIPAEVTERCITRLTEHAPKLKYFWLKWPEEKAPHDQELAYKSPLEKRDWQVEAVAQERGVLRVSEAPGACAGDKSCLCGGTGEHKYVIGADCSNGIGAGDFDCAYVLDATRWKFVAELHGQFHSDVFADYLMKLARWYGVRTKSGVRDCPAMVEANANGQGVNHKLNLFGLQLYRPVSQKKDELSRTKNSLGVYVGQNKVPLFKDNLLPALCRLDDAGFPLLAIPYPEFWIEARTFESGLTVSGRETVGAPKNRKNIHDDRIMSGQHAVHGSAYFYNIRSETVNLCKKPK